MTPPVVAIADGFAPVAFSPGRYATAIQRRLHGTHELQVLNEDSMAVLVLDLHASGSATGCRGWRYSFRNDGPEVHTEDQYREQQGYRGHYRLVQGVAEVDLLPDNTVCERVFEGALALVRAPSIRLRCLLANAKDPSLPSPVLLCEPLGPSPAELDPYVVEPLAPRPWFAIGSGNGQRVRVTGRAPGSQEGETPRATVEIADVPISTGDWQRAF